MRFGRRDSQYRGIALCTGVPSLTALHNIYNPHLVDETDDVVIVCSGWSTLRFDARRKSKLILFGFSRHEIRLIDAQSSIASKPITLLNVYIPATVDF